MMGNISEQSDYKDSYNHNNLIARPEIFSLLAQAFLSCCVAKSLSGFEINP